MAHVVNWSPPRILMLVIGLCVVAGAGTAETIGVVGSFTNPWPEAVSILVTDGVESVTCTHFPQSGEQARICIFPVAEALGDIGPFFVELTAPGFETWTRNLYPILGALHLGEVTMLRAAPRGVSIEWVRRLKARDSSDLLLEISIRNLSGSVLPLQAALIEASVSWGRACSDPGPVNPWQEVWIDWVETATGQTATASTELHGVEVEAFVQFRTASCGDYNHRLKLRVPLDVNLSVHEARRILLRISDTRLQEVLAQPPSLGQIGPLSTWPSMSVAIETTSSGFPVQIRAVVPQ